jgi:hypothetical protein
MSAASTDYNEYRGFRKPEIWTGASPHTNLVLGKGQVAVMKYDRDEPMHFYVQERIQTVGDLPENPMEFLEYREMLPKNYDFLPWDVVMIMTKRWVYVARPKPQRAQLTVERQAHDICEQVEDLLKDDERREEIDAIVCWVFYPEGGIMTKIHDEAKPFPTEKRMKIYQTIFKKRMEQIDWLKDGIVEIQPYRLGESTVDSQDTTIYFAQIAVDYLTSPRFSSLAVGNYDHSDYQESDYAALGFPMISLNTHATSGRGDGYAEAVVTSRIVWSTQKLTTLRVRYRL